MFKFSFFSSKFCDITHKLDFSFRLRRDVINRNLGSMNLAQQEAFGLWYSQGLSSTNITGGVQSVIRDTGNLIAYLPFQTFQQLSAAQVTALFEL